MITLSYKIIKNEVSGDNYYIEINGIDLKDRTELNKRADKLINDTCQNSSTDEEILYKLKDLVKELFLISSFQTKELAKFLNEDAFKDDQAKIYIELLKKSNKDLTYDALAASSLYRISRSKWQRDLTRDICLLGKISEYLFKLINNTSDKYRKTLYLNDYVEKNKLLAKLIEKKDDYKITRKRLINNDDEQSYVEFASDKQQYEEYLQTQEQYDNSLEDFELE